jgi:hypothetical protein
MVWISKRIIAYLKTQTALTSALGSANNIFIESVPVRKDKYVTVSASIGRDQNSIDVDRGTHNVTAVTSRNNANAHADCLTIVGLLDDALNKSEASLTNGTYTVLHFLRIDDSGLQVDATTEEFFYTLVFEFILVTG